MPPDMPSMRLAAIPGTVTMTPTGATVSYASHCTTTPEPSGFKNDYVRGGKTDTSCHHRVPF